MRKSENLKLPLLDPQDLVQRNNINALVEDLDEKLFKKTTAALFGMTASAVPDDVLAFLGQYNQHWWSVLHGQAYSYYREVQSKISSSYTIVGTYMSVQYAKSISIDPDSGDISLIDPTTLMCRDSSSSVTTFCSTLCELAPVYILATENSGDQHIFYIPDGATYTDSTRSGTAAYTIAGRHNSSTGVTYVNLSTGAPEALIASLVTSEIVNVPAGATTYVHSSDRNAYPDSGTVDDLTYQYLGIPFENAVTAPRIETGSYVGTGTYGEGNPNSLTFDEAPDMVILLGYLDDTSCKNVFGNEGSWSSVMCKVTTKTSFQAHSGFGNSTTSTRYCKRSSDGKTYSWYHTNNSSFQFNYSERVYFYAAVYF